MPRLYVSVNHDVGQSVATELIRVNLAPALQANLSGARIISETWNDHTLNFELAYARLLMRFDASGTLQSLPREVIVDAELPTVAGPFMGTIEATLKEVIKDILAKANAAMPPAMNAPKPHMMNIPKHQSDEVS